MYTNIDSSRVYSNENANFRLAFQLQFFFSHQLYVRVKIQNKIKNNDDDDE